MFGILNQFPLLYKLTPAARRERALVQVINEFIDGIISNRRSQLTENGNAGLQLIDEFGIKTRISFLDLLLRSNLDGTSLSNDEIRQEVNTFMFAGHDTTTSAITFAIYSLALHPEIQERVFEEQRTLLGNDLTTFPDYNALQQMKYLEMVIKESMRLYPPVPIIGREPLEPVKVGTCMNVPPYVSLNIAIYTLHRNPDIYEDPEKFDPDRFTEEAASKRGPYDYIPFSAGPRNCIGQRFAMLEIKSTLSTLVRNFKIVATEKTKGTRYASDLILRPIGGLFVAFEERKY